MDLLGRILSDGLIAVIPFSAIVWATFLTMPRIWLHSLPADIQALAPAKTPREKRLTFLTGIFVMAAFFGVPIALTWRLQSEHGGLLSFIQLLAHLYGVWMVVNLWDLVVIDWGYTALVNPAHPPIPGTAGAAGYKNYRFHLFSSLKASVFSLIVIIPAAALISMAG